MSDREDKIRRVVAELDVHMAEVEASVAVLKALLSCHHQRCDGILTQVPPQLWSRSPIG